MRILVSHVNFPSQFRRLIPLWVKSGFEVIFLARQREWHSPNVDGYKVIFYNTSPRISYSGQHPYLKRLESAVVEGQEVFRIALELKKSGWYPDCVISHVGFGNGLFLRDCFPRSKRIGLVEWFYNADSSDVDFLPPYKVSDDHRLQLRIWNSECLLEMSSLDKIVVPTYWQRHQFPLIFRDQLEVIHEGIDTSFLNNLRLKNIRPPNCLPEDENIQVLTYVSRSFEEYRGFYQVVITIGRLLDLLPNLHVLMVGQDGVSYGSPRSGSQFSSGWAKQIFASHSSRVHWLGLLNEGDYHAVLSVSDVHFYLSIPFILSWSLLEAMAAGCSLVVSDTEPLREVLVHEHSALLVDFFSVDHQVAAIQRLLSDSCLASQLASNARLRSLDFSVDLGHDKWNSLIFS